MFSTLPYYAVIANLLYSFNLVNYSDLDEIEAAMQYQNLTIFISSNNNQLHGQEKCPGEGVNIPELVQIVPESIIIPSGFNLPQKPSRLPQSALPKTSLPSFALPILWIIAVYVVSLQGN